MVPSKKKKKNGVAAPLGGGRVAQGFELLAVRECKTKHEVVITNAVAIIHVNMKTTTKHKDNMAKADRRPKLEHINKGSNNLHKEDMANVKRDMKNEAPQADAEVATKRQAARLLQWGCCWCGGPAAEQPSRQGRHGRGGRHRKAKQENEEKTRTQPSNITTLIRRTIAWKFTC